MVAGPQRGSRPGIGNDFSVVGTLRAAYGGDGGECQTGEGADFTL